MSPELHAQLFEASGQDAAYIGVAVPPDDLAGSVRPRKSESCAASTVPFRTKRRSSSCSTGGYRRARPALGQHGRLPRRKGHRLQYRHPRLFRVARTRRCGCAAKGPAARLRRRGIRHGVPLCARGRMPHYHRPQSERPPRSSSRSPRPCRTRASPYTAAATSRATSRSY